MRTVVFTTQNLHETLERGESIGARLQGGEIFEFKSDLGGGKTSFIKGLVKGFGSPDPVASPTFTISNLYQRPDGKQLHHFDFYRLQDPGIVALELAEVEDQEDTVVVEWGGIVDNILPKDRITIDITVPGENERIFTVTYPAKYHYLFQNIS